MNCDQEVYVRHPQVLERWVEGDVVLYQPITDDVTLLDQIAALVWSELATPTSADSAATKLAQRFDADASAIADDITQLFLALIEKQLIEVSG